MATPAFDHDPGLGQRVEDLAVEELVPKSGVEALAVAILPWAARLDECGLRADGDDPFPHGYGDKFRPVVRPYVGRHAAQDEQVGQGVDDAGRVQLSIDPDRQAFPGELVDDVEHAEFSSVMSSGLDEVVGPHVVGILRPKTDA